MICFGELPDDARFKRDAAVNKARTKVAGLYTAAMPAFVRDEQRIEFPAKLGKASTDHWTRYKDEFARQQHGRCGYCELPVVGGQYGDVEHYRPKGMVEILDLSRQGSEKQNLSNVEGRRALRRIGTGYWWHAYSWDNYLLTCVICNQGWKRNFFPVDGNPIQRPRPDPSAAEGALLLYPFGTDDPVEHFQYDLDGCIRGVTSRGVATIETVGLWRTSLVVKRRHTLATLHRLILEMRDPDSPDALVRSHARSILAQGSLESLCFPGMTRIFFRQYTGLDWVDLETMVAEFQTPAAAEHTDGVAHGDMAA